MRQANPRRRRSLCLLGVVALWALATAAPAQKEKDELPKWRIDQQYTKNKPENLQKAGYVSYGPFTFGNLGANPVDSKHIDNHLSYAQILWVETRHFRLGTNLPPWPVPLDPETRNKIRGELERLGEKIPGINPKVRTLDPWLRLHLYAQRLEELYAEFSQLAGVKDEDFPADASKVVIQKGARYMGQGPYLGMRDKYLVLLVEKEGTYKDYMKNYLGRDSKYGQRWHFKDASSLLYTVSTESDDGRLKHDTTLHCNVAFNVSQNLLDGFRYYSYELPVWIKEGIGHWYERRVDPKYNTFDQNEGSPADNKKINTWEPYCRNLVTTGGKFAPFAEAYAWRDFGAITFNDHVAIWSRIDWLMSQGPERWRTFLFEVKGRVDEQWVADQKDLVGATRDALQKAYGVSPLSFDGKWSAWVKEKYSAQ